MSCLPVPLSAGLPGVWRWGWGWGWGAPALYHGHSSLRSLGKWRAGESSQRAAGHCLGNRSRLDGNLRWGFGGQAAAGSGSAALVDTLTFLLESERVDSVFHCRTSTFLGISETKLLSSVGTYSTDDLLKDQSRFRPQKQTYFPPYFPFF